MVFSSAQDPLWLLLRERLDEKRVWGLLVPLAGQYRLESREQGGGELDWDMGGWDETKLRIKMRR